MVLIYHLAYLPQLKYVIKKLNSGVDGFFFMSGWLNCHSMESTYRNTKDRKSALKSFFIHRVFRILPIYYIVLILV